MSDDEIDLAEKNVHLHAQLAANAQAHAAQQISVITVVKLPPFWPLTPIECFFQVESVFSTNHINSERTRFNYLTPPPPSSCLLQLYFREQY